jgi:hypothetical protein
MQNAVCLNSNQWAEGTRINTIVRNQEFTVLNCTAASSHEQVERPTIVFADFEGNDYAPWTVEGEAFGKSPAKEGRPPQQLAGFQGKGLANSWTGSDAPKGKLISPKFTIERRWISFLLGGGHHPGETCINLIVDGKVVRTATGNDGDTMAWIDWGVRDLAGKTAHIEIVDNCSDSWGHIEIDQIEFRDKPRTIATGPLAEQADFGSMCLALLEPRADDLATAALAANQLPQGLFKEAGLNSEATENKDLAERIVGALARRLSLEPGQQATVTFVVAWYFPNILHLGLKNIDGRKYGKMFASATKVVEYLAANYARLSEQTRLWHATWYDSTLPYWFLDRTFANISILATSTAYWFGNNRFYAWEGVGNCMGTCQHVWHYAQAMGRIFPSLERTTREMVDYGLAFHPDTGAMDYRGEFDRIVAADGQLGTILRTYREHQMTPDGAFLKRNWSKIKKALEYMIRQDIDKDGILDGPQYNTLDATWYGKISWISSLYVAALRAGEQMAIETGDLDFARQARALAQAGTRNIDKELFNGEYYIQIADKAHPNTVGSYDSCAIDQVFGQSWAFQVGLSRVLPREHTLSALRSLWKYNFTPDVGAYRKVHQPGRWFAMPGEGGLLMETWPKGEAHRVKKDYDYYANECMTGFEYQVAGHMIWEGMVQEGLAITRAIHDRYHASRRNPWNEVECGDHYSRAMASYGVFLAACGYEYHGPKGYMAFSPRWNPEEFKAAFTSAESWGTLSQHREEHLQRNTVAVQWGALSLKTLAFDLPEEAALQKATGNLGDHVLPMVAKQEGRRVTITLDGLTTLQANEHLVIELTMS